jgi:hypothetical protein
MHEAAIEHIATEMAESGDYAYITIGDRSWRTATGRLPGASNLRPDVIALDRTGKYSAYEIISRGDTKEALAKRLEDGSFSIPKELRGKTLPLAPDKAMKFPNLHD